MKIGLINERSQASKNKLILTKLKEIVEPLGHEVFNYGMDGSDDESEITYVQAGIIAGILINSGAVDYVITGCGSGQGALLAANSFPGVLCGYIVDPTDAYLFSQINDGNAIAMPFGKGFGVGAELNLSYIFSKLFEEEPGQGYPREKAGAIKESKKALDSVKYISHKDILDILKNIDETLLKGAINGKLFQTQFFENCRCDKLANHIKKISKV